jgi:hypothetical protein
MAVTRQKQYALAGYLFASVLFVGSCAPGDKKQPGASRPTTRAPAEEHVQTEIVQREGATDPDDIIRVRPDDAHERVTAGKALLVCAYESDLAFKAAKLKGAISIQAFEALRPTLDKAQEIIFYCS